MQCPSSAISSVSDEPASPWQHGEVVELPLLVSGHIAGKLEKLAYQNGMTVGCLLRSLLDKELAQEIPKKQLFLQRLAGRQQESAGPHCLEGAWGLDQPAE